MNLPGLLIMKIRMAGIRVCPADRPFTKTKEEFL